MLGKELALKLLAKISPILACKKSLQQTLSNLNPFQHNLYRKVSYSEFQFYASGRMNCHFAQFKIELKKR